MSDSPEVERERLKKRKKGKKEKHGTYLRSCAFCTMIMYLHTCISTQKHVGNSLV